MAGDPYRLDPAAVDDGLEPLWASLGPDDRRELAWSLAAQMRDWSADQQLTWLANHPRIARELDAGFGPPAG